MTVRLIIDGVQMAEMMSGVNGLVMKHLMNRATVVQLAARTQARGSGKGTGRLASSIVKRPGHEGVNPMVMVGAWNCPYAVFVHEGTQPHDIYPKTKKALSFFWPNNPNGAGQAVFAHVHHPGTAPNAFLADQLHLAVD